MTEEEAPLCIHIHVNAHKQEHTHTDKQSQKEVLGKVCKILKQPKAYC